LPEPIRPAGLQRLERRKCIAQEQDPRSRMEFQEKLWKEAFR